MKLDEAWGIHVPQATPDQLAEELLAQFLTPEQQLQWDRHQYFDVETRPGIWFRVAPGRAQTYGAIVREDGLGICVWPIGLDIKADWALAMLLYLLDNDHTVVDSGCHGWMGISYTPRDSRFRLSR